MLKIGVIGLGMMGRTHLDVYARRTDVRVVAIADLNPERLQNRQRAAGNIPGQAQGGFDYDSATKYEQGATLIRDRQVEMVDICLPTYLHSQFARKALRAGKHVLVEKPAERTYRAAKKLAEAAEKADRLSMPAQCMRFWPGWTELKEAVRQGTYGALRAVHFRRVASHPGGPFYSDGDLSGGGILDLHVHDSDFVQYLLGVPEAVSSVGYASVTNQPDHVLTHYHFPSGVMVTAEGGWSFAKGFGFRMQFTANFESATLEFDSSRPHPTRLYETGKEPMDVPTRPGMGYEHEIDYFLSCVAEGRRPTVVTMRDAAV